MPTLGKTSMGIDSSAPMMMIREFSAEKAVCLYGVGMVDVMRNGIVVEKTIHACCVSQRPLRQIRRQPIPMQGPLLNAISFGH